MEDSWNYQSVSQSHSVPGTIIEHIFLTAVEDGEVIRDS